MMCGKRLALHRQICIREGLTDKEVITLETLSGIKILKLHTGNGW